MRRAAAVALAVALAPQLRGGCVGAQPAAGEWVITTIAGGVQGALVANTTLSSPSGVAADARGNVYVADTGSQRVWLLNATTGLMSVVAGNGWMGFDGDRGPATSATLFGPTEVAVDGGGNLLIADTYNHRIRRVAAGTGIITTVAGTGSLGFSGDRGPGTSAALYYPRTVAVDGGGNLLIADTSNHRIRRVAVGTGLITTLAGTGTGGFSGDGGPATSAGLRSPYGAVADGWGNVLIADRSNHRIRRVNVTSGVITTLAGIGIAGFSGDGGPATSAALRLPTGVAVDGGGNILFSDSDNHRIRRVAAGTGVITTLAGTGALRFSGDGGPATSAALAYPSGVAVDGGNVLLIADSSNHRIRRVVLGTGGGAPSVSVTLSSTSSPTPSSTRALTPFTSGAGTGSPLVLSPAGTPSSSASASSLPTPSQSGTPSSSATGSGTGSAASSLTASPSPSETASEMGSPSGSVTGTAAATSSRTPASTGTRTRAATGSSTKTHVPLTPSASRTRTRTGSAMRTRSRTASTSRVRVCCGVGFV